MKFHPWPVESYTSIPQHLLSNCFSGFLLTFGGSAPPDCRYIGGQYSGGLALQKLGRKRERWATHLIRTPSKVSALDAEQYNTPSGISIGTPAKLELP
jgi:hypothetical protein